MHRPALVRRALVVSGSVLIAEDLAETLREFVGAVVDARSSVDDAWGARYDIAIFDVPVERLLGNKRVEALRRLGTRLIVLDNGFEDAAESTAGLAVLMQPFRTVDVVALLESMGLPIKR